jgi:hypothetical protein
MLAEADPVERTRMGDSGILRPLTGWQRANVLAAAQHIRELILKTPDDTKSRAVYEGLLEVLEPARRVARQQRELADAAKAAVRVREQRSGRERRSAERRTRSLGPPRGTERRRGERRSGRDRRRR